MPRFKVDPKLIFIQQLKQLGIPAPVSSITGDKKEHQFMTDRKFAFDIAWVDVRLAVEIEGGIYGKPSKRCPVCKRASVGGHSSVSGILRDIEKGNLAIIAGWTVLRATPQQLTTLEFINVTVSLHRHLSETILHKK